MLGNDLTSKFRTERYTPPGAIFPGLHRIASFLVLFAFLAGRRGLQRGASSRPDEYG